VLAVDVVGGLEGQEGADAHHQGAEHLVAEVKVVVRTAGPVPFEDAVIRVRGGCFGGTDRKVGPCSMLLKRKETPKRWRPSLRRPQGRT
jgi:hypothetical protein